MTPPPAKYARRGLPLLALLLGGCSAPLIEPGDTQSATCRALFDELDRAVAQAGVRDQGPHRIAAFPYLRVDRFLASFSSEVNDPARFDAWTERLARLDHEARRLEINNLPESERPLLQQILTGGGDFTTALDRCRNRLIETELADEQNRQLLRQQAQVPDDYVTTWRVLGLYPLSALFVKAGIARWHEEVAETYALPLDALPQLGTWRNWGAAQPKRLDQAAVAELLLQSAGNPLAIPEPDPDRSEVLFATFAPMWRIDTVDENDLPGSPYFPSPDASASVDTAKPVVFRRLSHTRFHGEVLLQLNYILWFPARPAQDGVDIYAGPLDGINLRVTLKRDGTPLLYDTIHSCGCYHKFFPVAPLVRDERAERFWTETALVPQPLHPPATSPVVHVASRTHYVQRLSFAPQAVEAQYGWDDYAQLRSLPLADGHHKSLFGEYGLITGSERPERFLLWPMGIRSPGAMRQWGHHATAFLGRRHFDDPYLIETLFRLQSGQGALR